MKIIFKAFTNEAGLSGHSPTPAIRSLPEWYKKIPQFLNGAKSWKFESAFRGNSTVKWCIPFLDAMIIGYTIYLENDIDVQKQDGLTGIVWGRGGDDFVSTHGYEQLHPDQIPEEYLKQPYKFSNEWSIKSPKGYSLLFTHPLNRTDLPFLTLTGLVDSDTYLSCVNLPFLLKKDFEGIIPAGTPIAQVIPIKREPWSHKIEEYDEDFSRKTNAVFTSKIFRVYKKLFWQKKEYR